LQQAEYLATSENDRIVGYRQSVTEFLSEFQVDTARQEANFSHEEQLFVLRIQSRHDTVEDLLWGLNSAISERQRWRALTVEMLRSKVQEAAAIYQQFEDAHDRVRDGLQEAHSTVNVDHLPIGRLLAELDAAHGELDHALDLIRGSDYISVLAGLAERLHSEL
jgi:hypothetical protein